jgi:predicted nucleic acid-binding protein
MSARSFFDTNVLIYTDANDEPVKQARALGLIEQAKQARNAVLSTQVLNEYFAASTRKLGVPVEIARRKVELFAQLEVLVLQADDTLRAIDLGSRYRLSFWDALIVQAALRAQCKLLYSEDLQPGLRIGTLSIVNPF